MSEQAGTLAERFARDGILLVPGVVSGAAASALADAIEARLAEAAAPRDPEYARRFDMTVDVAGTHGLDVVAAAFLLPVVLETTGAALGPGWVTDCPALVFSTPAGGGRQGWHQDSSEEGQDQFVVNRIIYPRGVAHDQGALVVVRGSHRRGDIPAGGNHDDIDGQEELQPEPGTLALMHSRLWHRVSDNRSTRARTQVNHRVRPATARAGLCATPVFRTGRWDFDTRSSPS